MPDRPPADSPQAEYGEKGGVHVPIDEHARPTRGPTMSPSSARCESRKGVVQAFSVAQCFVIGA